MKNIMRKLLVMLCVVSMTCGMMACSSKEESSNDSDVVVNNEDEKDDEVVEPAEDEKDDEAFEPAGDEKDDEVVEPSVDWSKYEVSINGTIITLPCTYEKLVEVSGCTMKDSQAKSYLDAGYSVLANLYSDGNMVMNVEIYNYTEDVKGYTECLVTCISQSEYSAKRTEKFIEFPGGLQVGSPMTKEDLETIFGQPSETQDYVSEDGSYVTFSYTYSEDDIWTTHSNIKISVANGYISDLSIDNLYYDEEDLPELPDNSVGEPSDEGEEKSESMENLTASEAMRDGTADDVSADWRQYEFYINGKVLSLPCTYGDILLATGYTLKDAQAISYLGGGYYTSVNLYLDGNLAMYIELYNDTEEDMLYTDCLVTRIIQSKYQSEKTGDFIVFPNSLKVGDSMTKEELEKMFGEPDDTYDYEDGDYVKFEYTYCEDMLWKIHNCIEITVVNGYIDEITLDYLYFD